MATTTLVSASRLNDVCRTAGVLPRGPERSEGHDSCNGRVMQLRFGTSSCSGFVNSVENPRRDHFYCLLPACVESDKVRTSRHHDQGSYRSVARYTRFARASKISQPHRGSGYGGGVRLPRCTGNSHERRQCAGSSREVG